MQILNSFFLLRYFILLFVHCGFDSWDRGFFLSSTLLSFVLFLAVRNLLPSYSIVSIGVLSWVKRDKKGYVH